MLSRFLKRPKPRIPPGQRVYAIGDIHGRADLLDQLLEMLRRDDAERGEADTRLVFLGDLIDRGPASRAVVARIRQGAEWARFISIMGNHEAVMLEALDGDLEQLGQWLRYGGIESLVSWGVPEDILKTRPLEEILQSAREKVPPEDLGWISRMRDGLRIGDYYFVHAGIRPGVPIEKQDKDDRLWIREEFLESRKNHGVVIVHGHSINADVEERANRIGIDTGAYATGKLTALCLEADQRWYLATGD